MQLQSLSWLVKKIKNYQKPLELLAEEVLLNQLTKKEIYKNLVASPNQTIQPFQEFIAHIQYLILEINFRILIHAGPSLSFLALKSP
jgi:hypothetical protein